MNHLNVIAKRLEEARNAQGALWDAQSEVKLALGGGFEDLPYNIQERIDQIVEEMACTSYHMHASDLLRIIKEAVSNG